MEFEKVTEYIEQVYEHHKMVGTNEFIRQSELKEFCPVIETETARLLRLLLRLKAPKKVLEIGTSIGYSTTSMALVIREWGGKIVTIEFDPKVAEQARKNFERMGVAETIELLIGDALELLPQMQETFEFIFLDPFNDIYPQLVQDCVRLLNRGGLLVADDTLAPVLEGVGLASPLHEYNQRIAQHGEVESTILAVGDGVTLAVKK